MKKWMLAWAVFTAYLITNMTVMQTAEQPHLVATFGLGFFFWLIFGLRGLYGASFAVTGIVLLALLMHLFRHYPGGGYGLSHYTPVLVRLLLDLVMILGGGGLACCTQRLIRRHFAK